MEHKGQIDMVQGKIDILFFERPLADLKKFAFKFAHELKLIDKDIRLASVSIEVPEKGTCEIDFNYHRNQIGNIDAFLTVHQVETIIFTNPRVPDMEFILHAKRLGIRTIMVQEGVFNDGNNINDVSVKNLMAAAKQLAKTIYYIHIIHRMCRYDRVSFLKVLKNILTQKKNIVTIVANSYKEKLIADYVFTMGEHWKDYYIDTVGYSPDQVRVIGDHDLDGFTPNAAPEPAICYIATVLVEDGTVPKRDFDVLLDAMAETIDRTTKLYIKLHPRSNVHLYDRLKGHNVEFVREGALPSTTVYIGSRSTLLGRALYESDNLLVWHFPGEKKNFYDQYAKAVCCTKEQLKTALEKTDMSNASHEKLQEIEKVYRRNPEGAIKTGAGLIYRCFKEKKFDLYHLGGRAMKVVALIPVKLGSKRVPKKNIKQFYDGTPLMHFIQKVCLASNCIDETYIYCSDESIKDYVLPGVRFLRRPDFLDSDTANSNTIITEFMKEVDADIYVETHTTAPFAKSETLDLCVAKVASGEYDSAFCAENVKSFLWQDGEPLNFDPDHFPRTQDLPDIYSEADECYVFTRETFQKYHRRVGVKPFVHEIDKIEAMGIDWPIDFQICNAIYRELKENESSDK